MKTLLLILLLIPSLVEARTVNIVVGQPATADTTDACDSCPDAVAGGDLLCEDFEATGSLCTGWSETTTNCTTLDDDATHTGTWVGGTCTDRGSQTLKVKYTTSSGMCYTRKTTGADAAPYVEFYLNVTDIGTLASGSYEIFSIGNDTAAYVRLKVLYQSASQYKLRLSYKDTSNVWVTADGSANYDLDKYYRINIHTDTATNVATVKVEGAAADISVSDLYPYGTMIYYYVGNIGDAEAGAEMELDMLKVDSDAEPSGCTL